jgi:nitrogen regulatory protein PII
MLMVMFVLHNTEKLDELLDAWEAAGVPGITILQSTGLGRARNLPGRWDDLPLMPSLRDFYEHDELFSRTLFSVVPDETAADRVIKATVDTVGELNEANTGLLVVFPLIKVLGLEKKQP